jgi:hypothetical protein
LFSQTDSVNPDDLDSRLLKATDLPSYLARLPVNKSFQLERLCAYFFHQKINEYRIQNGKSWLFWNDDLWMAARNHNIYMSRHWVLSHGEEADSSFFTGRDPSSRLSYVTKNFLSCGENVCYFMIPYEENRSLVEYAYQVADKAFENWKKSPGHNENMLDDGYNMHGTAFNFYLYTHGTSVFSNAEIKKNAPTEISLDWDTALSANTKPNFIIKDNVVYSSTPEDVFFSASEKILIRLMGNTEKLSEELIELSNQNLQYIKANRQSNTIQLPDHPYYYAKTTKRRLLKQSANFNLIDFLFTKVVEKTAYIEFPLKDFMKPQSIINIIEVETTRNIYDPSDVEKWGYSIDFYKKTNYYVFVIDCVYILK